VARFSATSRSNHSERVDRNRLSYPESEKVSEKLVALTLNSAQCRSRLSVERNTPYSDAARASRAWIRLLRRRSQRKKRLCSLLLSTAGARFADARSMTLSRIARVDPPTSSSLAEEKAPLLPPPQHGGRAICRRSQHDAARPSRAWIRLLRRRSQRKKRLCSLRVHCSLRSLRLAPVSRCLPHSFADEERVCSLARPGQRRASLAQHGGRAICRRSQHDAAK
jgi:hypothetical protein